MLSEHSPWRVTLCIEYEEENVVFSFYRMGVIRNVCLFGRRVDALRLPRNCGYRYSQIKGLHMDTNVTNDFAVKNQKRNRRKKYIVDPSFQWRHAITISLTVFLVTSIMSSVLYGLLHQQARMRFVAPQTYTGEVTLVVLFAALAFAGITAAGVGLWSVVATHRICGPLYVLENYLGELAKGSVPTPRKLRNKDELKGFYRTFTRAMETLRLKRQNDLSTLCESLDKARTALGRDSESQKRTLEVLAIQLEQLRNEAAEAIGVELDESSALPVFEKSIPKPVPAGVA